MKLTSIKNFLIKLLFPQFCLNCNREGDVICEDCLSLIEILEYQFCPFCRTPTRTLTGICPSHRSKALNGLFAAVSYQNSLIRLLIKNFKYEPFLKSLAKPLTYLIISHFILLGKEKIFHNSENLILAPIPLSNSRKRWRGFNQAEEIAKILSIYFKIPLQLNNLIKIKKTQPQTELKQKQRQENTKGIFKLQIPEIFKEKIVFLIDDVFTTGATIREAAEIIKQAGARQVWGIVIAREA